MQRVESSSEEERWLLSSWWQPDLWSGEGVCVSVTLFATCVWPPRSSQFWFLYQVGTMGSPTAWLLGAFNEIIYAKRKHTMNVFFLLLERVYRASACKLLFLLRRGIPSFPDFFPFLSNERWVRRTACAPLRHPDVAYPTGTLYCSWLGWSWLRGGGKGKQQIPFPCETLSTKDHYLSFRGNGGGGGQVSEGYHLVNEECEQGWDCLQAPGVLWSFLFPSQETPSLPLGL